VQRASEEQHCGDDDEAGRGGTQNTHADSWDRPKRAAISEPISYETQTLTKRTLQPLGAA
jgi:hypothetical protein